MTFKKLFLIKDPCKKCIVKAACNRDCDESFSYSILRCDRQKFWRQQYPNIIILGLFLFALLTAIMGW